MKKKIFRYLQINILPFILQLFVRFIYITNKKVFHYPKKRPDKPFLVAMWHGDLLMQPLNYRNFKQDGNVKVIVSEHADGATIRKIVGFLGVGAIKGSSTRGGAKALINALKELKNGIDIAITPDGPKGPRHSVADGIVAISQKTGAKILCFSSIPTKYWQFNSWDKFTIPKPFGQIDFYISEPFDVTSLNMVEAKELIKEKMMINTME